MRFWVNLRPVSCRGEGAKGVPSPVIQDRGAFKELQKFKCCN